MPLILAVLLGLAAVMAVGRVLRRQGTKAEETTRVVVATRALAADETLVLDAVREKVIPISARPAQSVSWSRKELVLGQKALRPIVEGDYVLLSDVGLSQSMATLVGKGEWAVALLAGSDGIARLVQPGDEVAVIGSLVVEQPRPSADLSASAVMDKVVATTVLFPRVRVLDVYKETGELIVGLPPAQAQFLVAAQQRVKITLALRRPGDETMLLRSEAQMVDDSAFLQLMSGITPLSLPDSAGTAAAMKVE